MIRAAFLPLIPGLAMLATSATAMSLHFDTPTTPTDGRSVVGAVSKTTALDFLAAGTEEGTVVDVRVTATVKDDTTFGADAPRRAVHGDAGYAPAYNSGDARTEPRNDLGFPFYGHNVNDTENGIVVTFEFFDGTGALSGTFANRYTVSDLDFAIYDVDGETSGSRRQRTEQSEFFTAFMGDGLVAYAVGATSRTLVTDLTGDEMRFDGHSLSGDETDVSGAARLLYQDTQSLTLDFGSVMSSGSAINPVFMAFDGDSSLFSARDFAPTVSLLPPEADVTAVPLPSGLPLLLTGAGALMIVRRRRK